MLALMIVLLAGLATGLARGGSIRNMARARLAATWLILSALGIQVGAQFLPHTRTQLAFSLIVVSYAAVFLWAAFNWRVAGMLLIAAGAIMNFAVIAANQGMPISEEAARRAGFEGPAASRLVVRGKHFIDTGTARLRLLGDVIPLGGQPAAASVGDLAIWAGLIILVQDVVSRPRGRRILHGHGVDDDARGAVDDGEPPPVLLITDTGHAAGRAVIDLSTVDRDAVEWRQRPEASTLL